MHFKERGYEYVDSGHLARNEEGDCQYDTKIQCAIKTDKILC